MMTSRERVTVALNHREADRVPLDLGGHGNSTMHVSSVYRLRQALGLDPPGTPVKVVEPWMMLGEIKPDLLAWVGGDVVPLSVPQTIFGYERTGWKPWETFDGTPVLVPAGFNTEPSPNGDILMYPTGDRSAPPCARMPHGGLYFDAIVRQPPVDDQKLDPGDNLEEFGPISAETLAALGQEAERLYRETDKAILAAFGGTSFGSIGLLPGVGLKHPKGIRDPEEWYVSLITRQDYVYSVFERQCALGLANLETIYQVVGDRVAAAFVTGEDFGMQTGPIISPRVYRNLYKPFHKQVNDWIHTHTPWKTFIHSCGAVSSLIPDFIDAGFDILNPLQFSAADMDPGELKDRFGDQLVFWGGGVDTQRTLPFGTPDEVRAEVRERIRVLGPGGGFVFNPVHNVQAMVPVENLLALYETVKAAGAYPLGRG